MNYEKYYKDGNVAVLYSPGFGAGWHSSKGTAFEISKYDGSESVRTIGNEEFLVA